MLLCAGCYDVGEVPLDVCGNRVVEVGEDCDGDAGCNQACRYECDVELTCPQGWGCDSDAGICRAASGTFTLRELIPSNSYRPLVADMDADGRDDVLLVGEEIPSLVYFFGVDASAPRSVTLPAAVTAAAADVTGDELLDLLLGGESFLGYVSLPERAFTPWVRSSLPIAPSSRLLAADLDCDRRRDLLLLEDSQLSRVVTSQQIQPLGELAVSSADLVVDDAQGLTARTIAATGALPQGEQTACEILAVAERDADAVYVYGGGGGGGAPLEVTLLSTVVAPGPVDRLLFVDVNADGKQDLLLQGVDSQFSPTKYVAYGVGDGTYHSAAVVPATAGDGRAELALPEVAGTILSTGPAEAEDYLVAEPSSLGAPYYQDAQALDVTADGLRDVVAVTFGRLDVLRGHPTGIPSKISITSNGVGRIRDVGDFDGDGRADVLLNNGRRLLDSPSVLSVLYSPVDATSSPLELAAFDNTTQALVGYLQDQNGGVDPYVDVAVIHGVAAAPELSFLEGGADRQVRSPLNAPALDGQIPTLTFPAVGRFRGAAEIALLSVPRGGGVASLALVSVENGDPGLPELQDLELQVWVDSSSDAVAAFDADGDSLDELYFLGGPPDSAASASLFEVRLDESPLAAKPVMIPGSRGLASFVMQEVDGDGALDLTAIELRTDELSAGAVYARLGAESSEWTVLRWPERQCNALGGYAFVQADGDPPLELALTCAVSSDDADFVRPGSDFSGVLAVYDVDLATSSLTLRAPVQPGPVAFHLRVGDFNDDGVQDLISGSGEVALLLGEPRR